MKRLFTLFTGLCVMLLAGCNDEYDDSALVKRLDDFEQRLERLERLCNDMNTNLGSMQTIVTALDRGDYITSVEPLTENGSMVGYTIRFAKGTPIVVYNGKPGTAPVVSVKKDTDGIYYWTLDGEWITDGGKKLPVSGQNGTSPKLKIEEEYWYISYDDGTTWTKLDKATGEKGDDGAGILVDMDENYVSFTLPDGRTVTVPRAEGGSEPQPSVPHILYAVGQELVPGQGHYYATLWKDGKRQLLTDGSADSFCNGVYVDGNKVYVVGCEAIGDLFDDGYYEPYPLNVGVMWQFEVGNETQVTRSVLSDGKRATSPVAVAAAGEKPFRARQLMEGLTQGKKLSEIPVSAALRARLSADFEDEPVRIAETLTSKDGTKKFLFALADGNIVEGVLMKYKYGNTQCVSTQVGCRMGCAFCASTLDGCARSLTPAEMLDQVLFTQKDSGLPVSNIVLMGIGEPLDNFENVVQFFRILSHPDGMQMSLRHVALSTCGLVPRIRQLADLRLGVTLSVSLHSPENRHRSEIMPINRRYPVEELLDACRYYFDTTGRRVTIEYAVINGVNNTRADALQLARRLRGMQCHVNLIPVNPIRERSFRSFRKDVERFQRELTGLGINATIRRTLGSDIQAACGQLRRDADQQKQTAAQTVKNESGNTLFGGGKN